MLGRATGGGPDRVRAAEAAVDRRRRIGVALALVFAVLGLTVGLISLAWPCSAYAVYQDWGRAFERAGVWCAMVALPGLAAGLHLCCLPEFRRSGELARKLLRAERSQISARTPVVRELLWGVVVAGGLVLAFWWLTLEGSVRLGAALRIRNPLTDLNSLVVLGFSLAVPAAVGFASAFEVSASRRGGGARDLVLTPLAADSLAWAAAGVQQTRGFWMAGAAAPLAGWAGMLMFRASASWAAMPGPHWGTGIAAAALAVFVFAGIGYWSVRSAAAAGVWCGAVIGRPVPAGMLGAGSALAVWAAGAGLIAVAASAVMEVRPDLVLHRLLMLVALFLPAIWTLGVLVSGVCLWLARRALTAPVSLRAGAWLAGAGEAVLGFCGETAARDRSFLPAHVLAWPSGRRPAWRLPLLGIAAATALATAIFALAAEVSWRDNVPNAGFMVLVVGFLVLLALAGGAVIEWTALHRYLGWWPWWPGIEAPRGLTHATPARPAARFSAAALRSAALRKAGLAVAAAGLPVSLAAAMLAVPHSAGPAAESGQVWWNIYRVFVIMFVGHVALGAWLYARPVLAPGGVLAARLAAAETRRWRWGQVGCWIGLCAPAFLLGAVLLWHMIGVLPWSKTDRRVFCNVLAVAAAVCSLAVNVGVAGPVALRTARCRLGGAATDVLLFGPAARLLPWAWFRSGACGTLWRLAALSPIYAGLVMAGTMKPLRDMPWEQHLLVGVALFAGLTIAEYLCQQVAAAVGVWAGCAVPLPRLACALGVSAFLVTWMLRFVIVALCAVLGSGLFANRGLGLVIVCAVFCAAWVAAAALLRVCCLKAAQASLTAPALLRIGVRAVRRGERMMGLDDPTGERVAELFPGESVRPAGGGQGQLAAVAWAGILAVVYVMGMLWVFAWGLSEEVGRLWDLSRITWARLTLLVLLVGTTAFLLAAARLLRRRPGRTGAAEKEARDP